MTLFGFFTGETVFEASGKDAARIFNLCMKEKIPYSRTAWNGEHFLMTASGRAASRLCALCEHEGISLRVRGRRGLPWLWARYRGRLGLLMGFLTVALLFALSRGVVWRIHIEGNERLSDTHILSLLAEQGVALGAPLGRIETDFVEGRILLAEKDISWIALNVKGTTVGVELRETERGKAEKLGAANLVALCDGQIEQIEVYDGNVTVKKGDVVRRGELLVSGVYDTADGGAIHTVRAYGEVLARTVHEYSVEIPLLYEKKVYTGREWSEKTLKFFAKRIKVFTNTGKAPPTCDIIYEKNDLSFFGGEALPLGIHTTRYREYALESVTLTSQTAAEYAFEKLELELAALSGRAELLDKTIAFELTDEAYLLCCRVTCIENIAVTQEIEIE
ncbi:MAG: sporulation protein YqfD [Clostridia bacterium]|nr:sporulation protein YqfD [Clostridia bacterium]